MRTPIALGRVAITQRIDHQLERNERRDALDQRMSQWILALGLIPVPIPNALGESLPCWLANIQPHAIILSGGNDWGQCPDRDQQELQLLEWAKDRDISVLGLCRGMQVMGIHAGVSLIQVERHVGTTHKVSGLYTGTVNSFHQFALAECPSDYVVTACADDGTIEAISHCHLKWMGLMWHPERDSPFQSCWLDLAKDLLCPESIA